MSAAFTPMFSIRIEGNSRPAGVDWSPFSTCKMVGGHLEVIRHGDELCDAERQLDDVGAIGIAHDDADVALSADRRLSDVDFADADHHACYYRPSCKGADHDA